MKKVIFFLKLAFLCLILIWILRAVDIKEAINLILKINLLYFFIAILINNLSTVILTIKWKKLSAPLKTKATFLELLKLNYISMFYSMFVPGQASGELIKGLKLAKKEDSHEKVWVPIFIDKITNLLITFIIGLVAVIYDNTLRQNKEFVLILFLITLLLCLVTVVLFSENTQGIIANILNSFKINKSITKHFSLSYFEEYKKHNFLMLETFIWSLFIKLPHIFCFYFLALCLRIDLNLIQSAWLFSLVSIASLLPISFSGFGVREGTVLVLLSQVGIPNSAALSLSMLIFLISLVAGLIGGVIELFSGIKLKRHEQN